MNPTAAEDLKPETLFNYPHTAEILRELERKAEISFSDPRNRRLIVYPIHAVITVVVLARMCGRVHISEICQFWSLHKEYLNSMLYGLGDDVPSQATIHRIITLLNTEETPKFLTEAFAEAYRKMKAADDKKPLEEREVIAGDGQNIRATRSTAIDGDASKDGGCDVVSLYSTKYGIALGETVEDKKNQEAEAIISMIKTLNVRDAILTWDAINTRKNTLKAVTEAGADYVVSLKANQSNLLEEVEDALLLYDRKHPFLNDAAVTGFCHNGGEHGRLEEKTITILPADKVLTKEMMNKWESIASVIRVETERTYKNSGKKDSAVRYFVSSLEIGYTDDNFADKVQNIILSRWGIECTQHWVIDVNFMQDRTPCRNRDYIKNSTCLTKMAYNVLSVFRKALPENQKGRPNSFSSLQSACAMTGPVLPVLMAAYFVSGDETLIQDNRELLVSCGLIKVPSRQPEEPDPEIPGGRMFDESDDNPWGAFMNRHHKTSGKQKS